MSGWTPQAYAVPALLYSGQPRDWRRSPILEGIRNYNRDDCDSAALLAQWLQARQREQKIAYRGKEPDAEPADAEGELSETNRRRRDLAERMLRTETDPIGRLLGHLVDALRGNRGEAGIVGS